MPAQVGRGADLRDPTRGERPRGVGGSGHVAQPPAGCRPFGRETRCVVPGGGAAG